MASPAATPGHPVSYVQQQQQQFARLIFTDYAAFAYVVSQVAGHQVHRRLHVATAVTASPFVIQQPFMQLAGNQSL